MNTRFFTTALLIATLAQTGCATRNKMPFENDADRLTENSKPVYLMTATIKNNYKTSYQPKLIVVHVEKPNARDSDDRLNFTMGDKGRDEKNAASAGSSYLMRMELAPGQYEIRGLSSMASSFPINGFFFAPMHSNLEVKGAGVYYLGHVTATVRERQGTEFKAGSSVPLIDQAIAGASGGTFDISITDEFAVDEPAFRAKFPALANVTITKAILPPFDRAKAQAWWEKN